MLPKALALSLALFPSSVASITTLAPELLPYSEPKSVVQQRVKAIQKPDSSTQYLGDVYHLRKGNIPLHVYKCENTSADTLTNKEVKDWLNLTNHYLGYLSDGSLSLDLQSIKSGPCNQDEPSTHINNPYSFTAVIDHPILDKYTFIGMYHQKGVFSVESEQLDLDYDQDGLPLDGSYTDTTIHEILHGLIGPHSPAKTSSLADSPGHEVIGLTTGESEYLGWPKTKPIVLSSTE